MDILMYTTRIGDRGAIYLGGVPNYVYYKEQALKLQDFYYENGYKVMTEKYHLKRGYCCKNNCRHCPYER